MLDSDTCVNNLDNTAINVVWGTLGDLYTTAIWILPTFGKCIGADTASMPLPFCITRIHLARDIKPNSTIVLT